MSQTTMIHAGRRPDPLMRPAMVIAGLLVTAIVTIAIGGHRNEPMMAEAAAAKETLQLRFVDQPDGTVVAVDANSGRNLEQVEIGKGGFIRVTMRSFALERKQRGIGNEVPFTLTRHTNGALILSDETTGRTMLLNAFGPSNEGVFAELIEKSR